MACAKALWKAAPGRFTRTQGRGRHGQGLACQDAIDPNGLGYVFHLLFAQELVTHVEVIGDLIVGGTGNHDAARTRQRLQAVGDVYAVTVDVVALDDHVATVDQQ